MEFNWRWISFFGIIHENIPISNNTVVMPIDMVLCKQCCYYYTLDTIFNMCRLIKMSAQMPMRALQYCTNLYGIVLWYKFQFCVLILRCYAKRVELLESMRSNSFPIQTNDNDEYRTCAATKWDIFKNSLLQVGWLKKSKWRHYMFINRKWDTV